MERRGRRRVLALVVIFLVEFFPLVAIDWHKGSYLYGETPETVAIARSLATHGTFADAYGNTGLRLTPLCSIQSC